MRDRYQPTDADDYNHSLRQADLAMSVFGNGLEKSGGAAVVAGGVAVSVGSASLVTTAGTSAEVSVPAIAIGKGFVGAGVEATVWGGMMKANAAHNGSQGYDRGKKSNVSSGNKNSPHANQKRKEVNGQKYSELKEKKKLLKAIIPRNHSVKEQIDKIEREMKRAKQRMDFKGENHSRNSKGNRR